MRVSAVQPRSRGRDAGADSPGRCRGSSPRHGRLPGWQRYTGVSQSQALPFKPRSHVPYKAGAPPLPTPIPTHPITPQNFTTPPPLQTGGEPYTLAAYQGNLIGLQAMARLGCPWGPPGRALARAIFFHGRGRPPLTALDEMLRLGCPVDWRRVLAAAQRRECRYNIADEQLMEWILEGEELCRRRQAAHAARGRRVLGWVLRVACCGGRSGPDMGLFEGYDKMEVEEPSESESEDDFW